MWQHETSILVDASPANIWAILSDVSRWPEWNAGVERIALHGPFAAGTTFSMTVPGQGTLTSTLTEVRPERGFSDETVLGEIRVVVAHAIVPLPSGETRITYASRVTGPGAAEVGEAVTADFPEVLAALKARAEAA